MNTQHPRNGIIGGGNTGCTPQPAEPTGSGLRLDPQRQVVDPDVVLTKATIYWLPNTAASSARFYEDRHSEHATEPTTLPIGLAAFATTSRPCAASRSAVTATSSTGTSTTAAVTGSAHDAPNPLTADFEDRRQPLGDPVMAIAQPAG
jgi:hypothetical protein